MPLNEENPLYLTSQLITYIGNKRALLPLISQGLQVICRHLKREKITCLDMFSGSGIVSRLFKQYADNLIVNDMETYARLISQCYLTHPDEIDWFQLVYYFDEINTRLTYEPLQPGFITELYAPEDDAHIQPGERVFYTRRNACYLDTARQYIGQIPLNLQPLLLGPLLAQASVHANTGGVFKGFYKNKQGIGQFGGHGKDSITRITADISLELPILSHFHSQVQIYQQDANLLAPQLPPVDIAYLDPPYNQHPYGSNYFMLNLLVNYEKPQQISRVSGIPKDWQRSSYNKKKYACEALYNVCHTLKAKYLMISFNSEGFIPRQEMEDLLSKLGTVTVLCQDYPVFRASRNLQSRSTDVQEYLYILKKA